MDPNRSLWQDERAIEGLPIRLIIALVVGVASLGLMLNVLGGFGGIGNTEVTVEFQEGQIIEVQDPPDTITLSIIDEEGNSVPGATILLEPGTAQGDVIRVQDGGGNDNDGEENGQIEIDAESGFLADDAAGVSLRSDQQRGTYKVVVIPPSDSDWADEQENPEIVIISN